MWERDEMMKGTKTNAVVQIPLGLLITRNSRRQKTKWVRKSVHGEKYVFQGKGKKLFVDKCISTKKDRNE